MASAIHTFYIREDCRIPMVFGTTDGAHIPIFSSSHENKVDDYFNRKQRYTSRKQLMALKIKNGDLLEEPAAAINNAGVLSLILGDTVYGLKEWLIIPYTNPGNQIERNFNCEISKTRACVFRVFGLLKGRWRCFMKRLE